ncbi:MAG: hypothetical protein Q8L52_02940 [bacterium]|nr:hypothetical protein [bacterium]
MELLASLLVIAQALGATVGALSSVWGELAYIRALRDGTIDDAERAHLDAIARGLRFGMLLLLLSSLALVVLSFILRTNVQSALSPTYWTLIVLALLIIGVAWALSRAHISFPLGSATLFTAWWFLFFLTFGKFPALSFGAAAAFFVVATGIFYGLLQYSRFLILRK